MKTEDLTAAIARHDPLLADAVGKMVGYIQDRWAAPYPSKEQTDAVNAYLRSVHADGDGTMSESNIALRHIFRNAMVPLVQYIPSAFLNTVVGSIYIESLYSIPGMGGLLVTAIKRQDNTLVQALVLIYAVISILGLLFGDILMGIVDPRISFAKKEGSR